MVNTKYWIMGTLVWEGEVISREHMEDLKYIGCVLLISWVANAWLFGIGGLLKIIPENIHTYAL